MSEIMISVNSRARGGRRQLPRTKKVRSAAGAPSAGSMVRPREPSRWSRRRSAQPRLMHVHPCCGLQPQTLQLRACLPNAKETLTSKPHLLPRDWPDGLLQPRSPCSSLHDSNAVCHHFACNIHVLVHTSIQLVSETSNLSIMTFTSGGPAMRKKTSGTEVRRLFSLILFFERSGCRIMNISQSPKKRRFVFGLSCSLKQTSIAPSQCCSKKKNSTQNDEITSQRQSWWDPTSLYAERVRKPSQHSQRKSTRKRV